MNDNIGVVWTCLNQSSRGVVIYTIVDVADGMGVNGMGVRMKLCHTERMSDDGGKVADHLSKGELVKAREVTPLLQGNKRKISPVLKHCFANIISDLYLGRKCLGKLSSKVYVFKEVDYDLL